MIELARGRDRVRRRERTGATTSPGMDARRVLQLILAATWLLDGLLQYQSSMYGTMFGEMIGDSATGNPGVIARPISWNAALVEHHLVLLNTVFATIQLLLGLGIAYRPTVRVALAASIAWSLGVWWFGEGLGGVLSGGASPVSGGPGAVILYALLAVLLWPADRPGVTAPFVAARAVGAPVARLLWLVLWGSLAYFALTPANRAPQALHDMIVSMTGGEPGWVTGLENHAAALLDHQGLAASIVLAVALIVIAAGVFLPPPLARSALILALVVAAFIWVFGEAFGQILTGGATDPNSAPLLALLALAYWPPATAGTQAHRRRRPTARPPWQPARPKATTPAPKGNPHEHPRLDPGDLRRGHGPGRRGERRAAGDSARLDPPRHRRRRHRRLPSAGGDRHGGHAGARPEHPAERRLGGCLRRHDGLARLAPVAGEPGARPPPWPAATTRRTLVQSAAMLYIFAALAGPVRVQHGRDGGDGGRSSGGLPALHAPTLALIFALLLVAFAVHDLDRRAGVDGYFRTVGRPLVPAGSALAAAAAGPCPRHTAQHPQSPPGTAEPPRIPRSACCFPPPW